MPSLQIRGLNAGYGKLQILFDVSFSAPSEKITVIVGPNGSGKSTTLKTIFGLTTIYSGEILFDGKNIAGLPPHRIAKMGIAYVPQTDNVFAKLTVKENLVMATYGMDESSAQDRVEEVLEMFPILKERLDQRAGTLSGGERQMLAIGIALIRRPKLMLFDEPTAALAPKIAIEILDIIARLRDEYKITILLVEQNAKKALEYGDRAVLLVGGRVAFEGEAEELLHHPDLARMYLGLVAGAE
ncbi:putative branched-chain amino acid ABC transporter ATP-binding protein [Pyrodictium delaneyi]|uniref:ABC transporter ATP-binding protein n=1 Tax=Pyrodictium delaneyi TaxID=1273541 RepID=A0A0P0N2F5_9CREN|nr:ABC transporter ATP-binding protein [Pyrodictium delaneyi]ALL00880.1 putative branched-chain amino acid ABC transporter ATP-binding protein [Pyrodictium delaneyi]OWJ55497.1 ABC transporter ATP-binding protein [Pyrodictium delaneyi]